MHVDSRQYKIQIKSFSCKYCSRRRTEMVPDLIWAPDCLVPKKFGPREIWSPWILGPCMKMPYNDFHAGPNFKRPKFLGALISRGPNFLGTKKVRGPNEIGDHLSYSLQKVFVTYLCSSSKKELKIILKIELGWL